MYPKLHAAFMSNNPLNGPAYTVENGNEKAVANQTLSVFGQANNKTIALLDSNTKVIVLQETQSQLVDLLNRITLVRFFADYRRIKEHAVFRQIYGYAQRYVNYCQPDGSIVALSMWTFPCIRCGIVLPEGLITIDHQKPQEGGQMLAILKVLRVFGLTMEGPSGIKGQQIAAKSGSMGNLHNMMMGNYAGPTISPHASVPAGNKAARQTLTQEGTLVYSALRNAGDLPTVLETCMHSIVNLKPLCLRCNTTKGNTILG